MIGRLPAVFALVSFLLAPPASERVFLVGADIHVGDGTVIEDGVVEIVGERIVSVGGASAKANIPSNATRIDVTDKLITPGFIAADSPLGLVEIGMEESTRDDQRRDATEVRAGFDPSLALNADSSLLPVCVAEGVTTAAAAPTGGLLLDGQVTFIDLLPGRHGKLAARTKVAVDGNLGQSHAGSRAAALEQLRRVLTDARFYRANRRAFDRGQSRQLSAHPLDLEALFPVLDRRVPLTLTAHRASDILALLALAAEFKIRVVVVGGTEAWKVREQLAAAKVPVVVQPTSNLPGSFERLGSRLDNAALLAEAGVDVLISDFGDPHNIRNIKQEAGNAIAHGLDRKTALRTLTLNVARAYGMDADYGTVARGKIASLVVWDKDPFELSSFPTHVFVRGNQMPLETRQTKLRDRYLDLRQYRP
jgi:imidazolonepropionase-like amidohydrolase